MTAHSKYDYLSYRIRILPIQLRRARHRVRQLEAEARRLKMFDLLENKE